MAKHGRLTHRPGRPRADGAGPVASSFGRPARPLAGAPAARSRGAGSRAGKPLDAATRVFMEGRFGGAAAQVEGGGAARGGPADEAEANRVAQAVAYPAARPQAAGSFDFSETRVHTSPEAAASAAALGARAFTVGRDIFFAAGSFRPDTAAGRELLAHELTHTVQQGAAGGVVQMQKDEPPTSTSDTVKSVFAFEKGGKVALAALFPDSLFGFAPNRVSNWVHGFQDQSLSVDEVTDDVFRATASGPIKPKDVAGGGTGGAAVSGVTVKVERIGGGRFLIRISSGAAALAAQEVRSTRSPEGSTVLAPVAAAPPPVAAASPSPAEQFAKSDAAPPLGLEGQSKADKDKAVLDSIAAMNKPPPSPADASSAETKKYTDGLGKVAEAVTKLPEFKALTDAASKEADKLPTVVVIAVPVTLLAGAFAGLVATKTESPVTTSPDIPLPDLGGVKMKLNVTYKGPANKPTEASATLTFAKGSLEVAPAFKATWRDPTKPPGIDNAAGVQLGLSVKIPLGPEVAKKDEPTDTDKMRAEAEALRKQNAAFKASIKFTPGSPEAKAAEAEKKALDATVTGQPFQPKMAPPAAAGPWTAPQVLQTFDVTPGAGKRPWNLDLLSRQIAEAWKAAPGATFQVVAIYAVVEGSTEQGRKTNGDNQDAANAHVDVVKRALEQWLPAIKGRIQTVVETQGGGRTFGLTPDAAAQLGARDVSVIFQPGS
jgi:hypothetical protein